MGIYIKGMEMPRSCFYCPFQHKSTTECLLTHKVYNWGLTTPPSDCPLIPVPPHGRLGDLDKIKESIRKQTAFLRILGGEFAEIAETLEKGFLREIDNAPTIIPAEEGDT